MSLIHVKYDLINKIKVPFVALRRSIMGILYVRMTQYNHIYMHQKHHRHFLRPSLFAYICLPLALRCKNTISSAP